LRVTQIFDIILSVANACSGRDVRLQNGGTFIRNLGEEGGILYLHKLYAPSTEDALKDVDLVLGFTAPEEYTDLLKRCNGATLFERSMHLYGYGTTPSRSFDPEHQIAVSASLAGREFSADLPELSTIWRPIGSITVRNKLWLCICAQGEAAIFAPHGRKVFNSLSQAIFRIMGVLSANCGCDAPLSSDTDMIERELLSSNH
jgi:hypothetical protein